MALVLDASAAIEIVLSTRLGHRAMDRIGDETLHAPDLLGIEVVSVLRRLVLAREISSTVARRAIDELGSLGVERYEHTPLLPRVFELRQQLTAYDATYVALAEGVDAPLLTCDAKLAAAHGHRARIEWLGPA